jgi:hypothetical protein
MLRKLITWAIVAFIIFYIATQPTGAAALTRHTYGGLHSAATSLATFINNL